MDKARILAGGLFPVERRIGVPMQQVDLDGVANQAGTLGLQGSHVAKLAARGAIVKFPSFSGTQLEFLQRPLLEIVRDIPWIYGLEAGHPETVIVPASRDLGNFAGDESRELRHRVGNTLQIISSLLELDPGGKSGDSEYLNRFSLWLAVIMHA
ncbi:MAG: hypothetical protein E4H20_05405 [Spirochaetales bacterium]|nr:MAG: hypothetical protein E4H20_05405 [Spirochaetales bacterium]